MILPQFSKPVYAPKYICDKEFLAFKGVVINKLGTWYRYSTNDSPPIFTYKLFTQERLCGIYMLYLFETVMEQQIHEQFPRLLLHTSINKCVYFNITRSKVIFRITTNYYYAYFSIDWVAIVQMINNCRGFLSNVT